MHRVHTHTHTHRPFVNSVRIFCFTFAVLSSVLFRETRIGACTRNTGNVCVYSSSALTGIMLYLCTEAPRKCITTLCRTHDDDDGLCRRPFKRGGGGRTGPSSAFIYNGGAHCRGLSWKRSFCCRTLQGPKSLCLTVSR